MDTTVAPVISGSISSWGIFLLPNVGDHVMFPSVIEIQLPAISSLGLVNWWETIWPSPPPKPRRILLPFVASTGSGQAGQRWCALGKKVQGLCDVKGLPCRWLWRRLPPHRRCTSGERNQSPQWFPGKMKWQIAQVSIPFHSPNQTSLFKQVTFSPQTSLTHHLQPPAFSDAKQKSQELLWSLAQNLDSSWRPQLAYLGDTFLAFPGWTSCWRLGILLFSLGQRIVHTYMTFVIHLIVGEFHTIKADDLAHPHLSRTRWVWVNIDPGSDAWVVCIPGYHPLGAVIDVPENEWSVTLSTSQSQRYRLLWSGSKGLRQVLPANLKVSGSAQ